MRLLIVGGTLFVGRALTDAALARGHAVTLFNRGKTPAEIPDGVEHLIGDRDGDLGVLRDRSWDAVIDTCAYFPRQVRTLLATLGSGGHYTLISTISVYADLSQGGLDEESPLATPLGDEVTTVDAQTYGPLKSACEAETRLVAADRTLVIRPGIIVGPHDPTGRFAHWVRRFGLEEPFLAPGNGSAPLQVIDARDLADWTVRMIEEQVTGEFNALGPMES